MSVRPTERSRVGVLVIEDNRWDVLLIREMLAEVLNEEDYLIAAAGTLAEGVAMLRDDGVDIVLLDLNLPDSSGIETFLSVERAAPRLPIIVFTGNDNGELARQAVRRHAQDYLVKGQVTAALLWRSIGYALERKRTELALRESEERYRALLHEAKALSLKDPLTGLANRRLMYHELKKCAARARRGGQLAVILIDLDRFKLVNDTYGHKVGDRVLVEVAAQVARQVREMDLAVRYGGEEFLVVLPDATLAAARQIAERIRQGIESLRILPAAGAEPLIVTVSLGLAGCDSRSCSSDELLSRADDALYRAKARGRNRVEA